MSRYLVYQVSLILKYVSIYFFTIELEQVVSRVKHSYLNHLIKQIWFWFFLFVFSGKLTKHFCSFPLFIPIQEHFWILFVQFGNQKENTEVGAMRIP